jgi:PKD repeat protein
MYDFGEGKWFIEGDAIQDYHYNFPGEYTITFVVVQDNGVREKSSRKIVLKDIPKRILLNTSVSSGIVGKSIDFDTNGTVGQIETYNWDFWDGSTSAEAAPTHTYLEQGKYKIKITVTYADRTVRSTNKEITITD